MRIGQENYTGMLSGIYTLHGIPMLVITPMSGGGVEQHIPLPNAMVMINPSI